MEACVCVEILTTTFSALFFFPIRWFIRNTVRPFLSLDNASYWRSVWLIPATMLLSCYFSLPGNRHMLYISQIVSRVCIVVAVFLVCRIIADDYRHFQEKQAMTEQLNQQKVYYSAMVLDIENMRRQRHDIKHYFAAIQYYIDTNDTEGLQKYCSELLDRVESDTPLPYPETAPPTAFSTTIPSSVKPIKSGSNTSAPFAAAALPTRTCASSSGMRWTTHSTAA